MVALESVDISAILKAKQLLALDAYENVNYLRAIKRVIGMERFLNRGEKIWPKRSNVNFW